MANVMFLFATWIKSQEFIRIVCGAGGGSWVNVGHWWLNKKSPKNLPKKRFLVNSEIFIDRALKNKKG
jgi:hypothetical protein